ncbi:hypothetical protein MHU86_16758 [Fragilaria crotonensis]|nr:hypothetical protein MHU86_16758 [Fragilaria crotonensis]
MADAVDQQVIEAQQLPNEVSNELVINTMSPSSKTEDSSALTGALSDTTFYKVMAEAKIDSFAEMDHINPLVEIYEQKTGNQHLRIKCSINGKYWVYQCREHINCLFDTFFSTKFLQVPSVRRPISVNSIQKTSCAPTMSEGAAARSPPPMAYLPPNGDPVFGFLTRKWYDPPNPASIRHETDEDRKNRLLMESTYRSNTNTTSWYRFCTLGRYAVDGSTFDMIWNEFEVDPLRAHCLIWYHYMFHLDRHMDIPSKLESWATKRSQVYLAIHAPSVLSVDTVHTTWKALTIAQSISHPWTKVGNKQRSNQKQINQKPRSTTQLQLPFKRASSVIGEPATPTLMEGNETEPGSKSSHTTFTKSVPLSLTTTASDGKDTASHASSIGKISALIPNLNVPLNDGTHRITIRCKVKFELNNSPEHADEINRHVYYLLNELFSDDDGLLYKWGRDDLDHFNSLSKMTPSEVRAFIAPSITLIQTLSIMIIPIRFGFSGMTPSTWRNKVRTKMSLEQHEATVSISNSKTTSSKLVIGGYILLKAPMTTHRIPYLQSIRSMLPETTPHFDILLHRTTPLGQKINHLVVQCGEKHVHPLSQALLTVLTGYRSPVYIPRFAFADMTSEQATKLFTTHDDYIKSLRSISLFPMLTNLDTLRTEHFPDGNTLTRSTRKWALGIMSLDGTESAKCDVVNGGIDQKAYLIFPPQSDNAARLALEEYSRRIFPFTQREARFRDSVGPPNVIHVKSKVDANLQLMESLSSNEFWKKAPASVTSPQGDNPSVQSDFSPDNTSTSAASAQSGSSRPQTSLESLQKRYRQDHFERDGTTVTSATSKSPAMSINSSNEARFKELKSLISRQQKELQQSNKQSTQSLQQIETQLQTKLDEVKQEVSTQIHSLETKLLISMQQQADAGDSMKELNGKIERRTNAVALLLSSQSQQLRTIEDATSSKSNEDLSLTSTQNPDDGSMHTSSTGSSLEIMPSPQYKKLRSVQSSEGDATDDMDFCTPDGSERESDSPLMSPHGGNFLIEGDDSTVQLTTQQTDDNKEFLEASNNSSFQPDQSNDQTLHTLADITADLEARYNTTNAPGGGDAT